MKIIKYDRCTKVNHGTQAVPVYEEVLSAVEMPWNEVNEQIAAKESYQGKYTVEDDGLPEPEVVPTTEERVADLEEALGMILSGVTE